MGLLLLRFIVGLTVFVLGWRLLVNPEVEPVWAWGVGAPATCVGVGLAIGFLTPLAAALAGVGIFGVVLGWFPAYVFSRIDSTFAAILMICICVTIVLVGPGALSLDARMFGRREIVIPAKPSPSDT